MFLVACAAKQPLIDADPALESVRLQIQKEEEQFKQALDLILADNAQESKLLKAKAILDTLYQGNSAYLGALINSADISLRLDNLDEAKTRYLDALQKIEDQKVGSVSADKSTNTNPVVSEHITMFAIHTYNQLGLIDRKQGQFDQAEAYYRQALALNPTNPITIKNLAILLDLYKGKLVEALALYEQYQSIIEHSDPQITDPKIKDWIYDLKNRLPVEKEEAGNE